MITFVLSIGLDMMSRTTKDIIEPWITRLVMNVCDLWVFFGKPIQSSMDMSADMHTDVRGEMLVIMLTINTEAEMGSTRVLLRIGLKVDPKLMALVAIANVTCVLGIAVEASLDEVRGISGHGLV